MTPLQQWLVLLAAPALLVAVDICRNGRRARRLAPGLFLLLGGVAGTAVGVTCDAITFEVGPEYFEHMKGLHSRGEVLGLGARAGGGVGLLVAGLLLIFDGLGSRRPPLGPLRLARQWLWPLGLGGILALAGAGLYPELEVARSAGLIEEFGLEGEAALRFERVWGIHTGLYLGALLGIVAAGVSVFRARSRAPACPTPPPSPDA